MYIICLSFHPNIYCMTLTSIITDYDYCSGLNGGHFQTRSQSSLHITVVLLFKIFYLTLSTVLTLYSLHVP